MVKNISFIDTAFRTQVDTYLASSLPHILVGKREDFLPKVLERIKDICNQWRESLHRQQSRSVTFAGDVALHVDEEAIRMIATQFAKVLQLTASEPRCPSTQLYKHELFPDLLNNAPIRFVTFSWTPKNIEFASQPETIDVSCPDANSKRHYHWAQEGIHTDFALESKDGTRIPMHKLYVEQYEYFQAAVHFSEGQRDLVHLAYSEKALRNLQQYIYLEEIDPNSKENLDDLLELVGLSHELNMKDLYQLSVKLTHEYLQQNASTVRMEGVIDLIEKAIHYEIESFIPFALTIAENTEDTVRTDWTSIEPRYLPRLLKIATQESLEKTAANLTTIMESLLSPALSTEAL